MKDKSKERKGKWKRKERSNIERKEKKMDINKLIQLFYKNFIIKY